MPRQIGSVSKGPPGLVKKLNEIISWINSLSLIKGAGINVTLASNGWVVSAVPFAKTTVDPTTAGTPQSGSGGGSSTSASNNTQDPNGKQAGWVQVNIIDNSTGSCVTRTGYFWGTIT